MKLYHHPLSPNCRKVLTVVNHLGLDLEMEVVDILKGKQRDPEFLAINPNGKVPALVDGELSLWESNAVMSYLAGKAEKNDLWPPDMRRYDIMRWMYWEQAHWSRGTSTLIGEYVFKSMRGEEPDPERVAEGEAEFSKYASVLNNHLEGKTWLVGDGLTLADFAVGALMTYAVPARYPLDDFPHINAWYARLEEQEAWQKSAPPRPG